MALGILSWIGWGAAGLLVIVFSIEAIRQDFSQHGKREGFITLVFSLALLFALAFVSYLAFFKETYT